MKEMCVLKRCEWANAASGNCLWPRTWCPYAARRRRREQLLERNRQAQALARERRKAKRKETENPRR